MPPFFKSGNTSIADSIIKNRTPDKPSDSSNLLETAAQNILDAITAQDPVILANALKTAFKQIDQEPHVEGKHIEPHSYDAQKSGE